MSDDGPMFPKPSKAKKVKPERERGQRSAQKELYARYVRPAYFAGLAHGQGHDSPACERCGRAVATELHHKAGRSKDRLLDPAGFAALCEGCHYWVHHHPEEAMEEGWLTTRHGSSST